MIKVIKKAARILDIVSKSKRIAFADICEVAELNRSTVSHILTTLVEIDFLRKDGAGVYTVGEEFLRMGGGSQNKNTLMEIASRVADDLIERINELTVVAMYHNGQRLTLLKKSPQKRLMVSYDDKSYPSTWYSTANGRVLLAGQENTEREKIIEAIGLPPPEAWPEATTTDALSRELDKIRDNRLVAFSIDEMVDCLGMPVPDAAGRLCFAISCAVPVFDYKKISREAIMSSMREAAEHFRKELALNNVIASEIVL